MQVIGKPFNQCCSQLNTVGPKSEKIGCIGESYRSIEALFNTGYSCIEAGKTRLGKGLALNTGRRFKPGYGSGKIERDQNENGKKPKGSDKQEDKSSDFHSSTQQPVDKTGLRDADLLPGTGGYRELSCSSMDVIASRLSSAMATEPSRAADSIAAASSRMPSIPRLAEAPFRL